MENMFGDAVSFNQDINNWDVSNVTCMKYMFCEAESYNQPLNNWNVNKVDYMDYMLDGTLLEKNNNLPTWYDEFFFKIGN